MNNYIRRVQTFLYLRMAALITEPTSRRHLTGFESSDGIVVITREKAVFFVDSRYFEAACRAVNSMEVRLFSGIKCVKEFLDENYITGAYIETERMTVAQFKAFRRDLGISLSQSNKMSEIMRTFRMIKTEEQLSHIVASQRIADAAFEHILNYIQIGVTEKQLAFELEMFMRNRGSEGMAFPAIVVSGKNTSLPHGVPTSKKIENGDFVTMDFGAVVNGYCSDMTRTVAVGEVSDRQREVYETVLKAQQAAISEIAIGKRCFEIDKVARDIIDNAGYKECFGHALGHGVGLEIHEYPNFSPGCKQSLSNGMVITVEPGIYIENEFGVRIEDMIVVRQSGAFDITKSPRELIIL